MENGNREVIFPHHFKYLAMLISLLCASLIIIHAFYSQFTIDTTTLALIVILIFPWLLPYIKTLKLPGGTEVTFKDQVQQLERLSEKSKIVEIAVQTSLTPTKLAEPTFSSLFAVDPNLALASLRIEIERKSREIARQKDLRIADERVPLRQILQELHSKKVIASSEFQILNVIIDVCNRAVHAEKVDMATASQILDIGKSAISYLESLSEKI